MPSISLRALLAGLAATVAVGHLATPARAGSVSGAITIDATRFSAQPPPPSPGFLDRIENPLAPIKPFDPLPYMIVVLEGGPSDETPTQPTQVRYDIVGESFERPVIPVLLGSDVELHNSGRSSPIIAADGKPDLLPAEPMNPQGGNTFKAATAGLIVLRAPKAAHLVGRVLVLPHRFFAAVDATGKFELPDVPAGRWTLRIWYRDGWLDRTDDVIEVGKTKITVQPKVTELKLAKAS